MQENKTINSNHMKNHTILNQLSLDNLNHPTINDHLNNHSHYPLHRRDSSVTSIASSLTPRTASSASLAQLANPLDANHSMLLSNSIHSPLSTIVNKLPSLAESQQVPIKRTLQLINHSSNSSSPDPSLNDPALLLAHPWTMFFSDTSGSKNNQRHHHHHHHHHSQREHSAILKAAEYQSGMSRVFTEVADVESLCASLSAFKMTIAQGIREGQLVPQSPQHSGSNQTSLRRSSIGKQQFCDSDMGPMEDSLIIPGNGLGLIAMKAGHNLHFFRAGVNPVWEDPWNHKGGRLMIQTTLSTLDPTFESLVLLIAGGVLETDARKMLNSNRGKNEEDMREGGRVVGVVGSRRNKPGDRIEIWLSGPTIGTAPIDDWVQCIHHVLIREINLPEVRMAKYKNHYN